MILKHTDAKNKTCYFGATAMRVAYVDLNSCDITEEKEEDKRLHLVSKIKQLTNWNYNVSLLINGELDITPTVCAILLDATNEKDKSVVITNECTYLMNDSGTTIERLN